MTMVAEDKTAVEEQAAATGAERGAGSAPAVSAKIAEILSTIEQLSVLELSQLVKALEERFGVSAAAPMVVAGVGAGPSGASGESAAEEKTAFDVVLADVGANKIQVIKEIRTVTDLGLKEAKELVESAPKPIKQGVKKDEAAEIKKKLEAVGAKIEIQ